MLRVAAGRKAQPSAAILDSRTLRSSPESGARAGYEGAKRKRGSKLHLAVDTLGHLLALHITPASTDDRAEVGRPAQAVQSSTCQSVDLAHVDGGYIGPKAADTARAHGIELEVVKLLDAKRGFVLLPSKVCSQPIRSKSRDRSAARMLYPPCLRTLSHAISPAYRK